MRAFCFGLFFALNSCVLPHVSYTLRHIPARIRGAVVSTPSNAIAAHYQAHGYVHLPAFFARHALQALHDAVRKFHAAWIADNATLYSTRAVNSAWLTGASSLSRQERQTLFQFIAQQRVAEVLAQVFDTPPAFMNTQLFFNPVNPLQPNYWHRDIQYTGMTVQEQQQALGVRQVVHLRVALQAEPGLELVPGSHRRWDTPQEFAIRMEQDGHRNSEAMAGATLVPLQAGDLLVFSANMLHRGLYGMNRLAFDMLFCDPHPTLLQYVQPDCLPDAPMLATLECPDVFLRAGARGEPAA